jgi:hypothetical protein
MGQRARSWKINNGASQDQARFGLFWLGARQKAGQAAKKSYQRPGPLPGRQARTNREKGCTGHPSKSRQETNQKTNEVRARGSKKGPQKTSRESVDFSLQGPFTDEAAPQALLDAAHLNGPARM